MRRIPSRVNLVAVLLCGLLWTSVAHGAEDAKSREQIYYERIIRKVEPDLIGSPGRLALYVGLFERELINDLRLFPVDVHARWDERRRAVVLTGFVGFEENHTALVKLLGYLGFDEIDDRIEVAPSEELGRERFGLVKVTHCFSYDRPDGPREVLTDCLLGSPVLLLKQTDDGHFLCHAAEGYVGYVASSDIRRMDAESFARYQSGRRVYLQQDHETSAGLTLPVGCRLKWSGQEGNDVVVELPSGHTAVVLGQVCAVSDGRPDVRLGRVVERAAGLLGTPYVWGGNTSSGIDCSGLMQTSFAAEGINLPRDASQQVYMGTLTATRWHRDGLRPGDTLFFLSTHGKISHTAVYVGEDRYLEAVRPVVRYSSFDPEDDAYNERRAAAFCFGKRLLE